MKEMYDFHITCDIDGSFARQPFCMMARTLAEAVRTCLQQIHQDNPLAKFVGLTYYHPPLD